ncbi:MAG: DNA recombination protein RmuC [Brevinema sp.]
MKEQQAKSLSNQINHLKEQIQNLSSKEYSKLLKSNSLDYIIMFISFIE